MENNKVSTLTNPIKALAALVAVLAVFVILTITGTFLPAQKTPALQLQVQDVSTQVVHNGQPVHVPANCNKASITYNSNQFWISIDPPGTTVNVPAIATVVNPTCVPVARDIQMPLAVQQANKQYYANGFRNVSWKVAGTEPSNDPVAIFGLWETTIFKVIP